MTSSKLNLESTINKEGKTVTQIIHFEDGIKRTFDGILPETIKQGQFTKMRRTNGSLLVVNDSKVLCIEIFEENE
jgi:hypothetical protein